MQPDFLHHGALSVLAITEIADVVKQCNIDIYSQDIKDEAAQQALFNERLQTWLDAPVWLECWRVEERTCFDVFLSEGEMLCARRRFRKPRREGTAHALRKAPAASSGRAVSSFESASLGELIVTEAGRSALSSRLEGKYVAPYVAADLVGFDLTKSVVVWAWDDDQLHPIALLDAPMPDASGGSAGTRRLCIPSAWGPLYGFWHGGLHLHVDHVLVVCSPLGRYGLVRLRQITKAPPHVVGEWLQACDWTYLGSAGSSPGRMIEAARSVEPDARGELVCDLIATLDGRVVNPPGIKGLLGTSHYEGANFDGCLVVNEAGQGRHTRVLGRVTRHGVLLRGLVIPEDAPDLTAWTVDDLRWLALRPESEGLMAVCSAENGRWGYVDRHGTEVLAPHYDAAWSFNYGTAEVRPQGGLSVGLIDRSGQWVLPPVWRTIERRSQRVIVVENAEGCWGALNAQGGVIVAFQPFVDWLEQPEMCERLAEYRIGRSWETDPEEDKRQTLIEHIEILLKREFRDKIRAALKSSIEAGGSLAGMEGVFDGDTSEGDLRRMGLWNLPVTLLRDKQDGMLQPRAGESGRIAFYYPVSLSVFDLSVEAPVSGLASCPDAAVGVRWRDLAFRKTE